MLRSALTLGFAVAAIALGSSAPAAAITTIDRTVVTTSAQSDLIALINGYRASHGVQQVSANSALTNAAAWMSADMAAKNYMSHTSSDGRSPTQRMTAFGYPAGSLYTGENLGAGYGNASAILSGWQASAAHNAILLSPNYNAVGIGLGYNANSTYKWYWAADFGGPGGTAKVIAPAAPQPQPVVTRVATVPRASAPQPADPEPAEETIDPETAAQAARAAFLESVVARRVAHLFALLLRMGVI
jgi:uncharacterized protein YkwD